MKKESQTLFNQISKSSTHNLSTHPEETLAKAFSDSQPKIFSSADLWNIHRQRKTFVIR